MEWQGILLICGGFFLCAAALWFCANFLLWSLTVEDKPFLDWLRRK